MNAVIFKYRGGSNPGSIRRVYLTEVNENTFTGYDFEKRGYRQFAQSLVDGGVLTPDDSFTAVPFQNADVTAHGLQRDGFATFIDEDSRQVVGIKL